MIMGKAIGSILEITVLGLHWWSFVGMGQCCVRGPGDLTRCFTQVFRLRLTVDTRSRRETESDGEFFDNVFSVFVR